MRTRIIVVLEVVLILLAALFMTALAMRNLQPPQYEFAHIAQKLVTWYAGRMWTLWVLLLGLPFTVLVSGCAALLRSWNRDIVLPLTARQSLAMVRAHLATLFIAATTLIAGVILAIVVLHLLAN
jgi:CHASE1-domain containing sensor protein